ncbi:ReoY family proteolytic degradation factor [Alkalihalobacillus sp. 1P02AB]|uniref:ReoY family proteolytic degradation factor n=1 Tax=Alkalihalobacillus sp. 1P02AB TaxID=3132260 RepID=UPI0039A661DE
MSSIVPVVEKKDFLRNFLKQFDLKRRECAWLLNYLMSDDDLMEKVHFVEYADNAPKSLIISANGVDKPPFSFHKFNHITTDAEKAFHDIRLNQTEDIYIELHFLGARTYPPYLAVLEDNPYLPESKERMQLAEQHAEKILSISLITFKKQQLLDKIDQALDTRDEEQFQILSKQLKELNEM